MGIISRLRGTDRSPAVKRAVAELEERLPDGWRFVEFRFQMFCRRPVKLYAYGATVEGPDGRRLLAVATDEYEGVPAVRGLADAVAGRVAASPRWAPPLIRPRQKPRPAWPLREAGTQEEAIARDEALRQLPGAPPSPMSTRRTSATSASTRWWPSFESAARGRPESSVWHPPEIHR